MDLGLAPLARQAPQRAVVLGVDALVGGVERGRLHPVLRLQPRVSLYLLCLGTVASAATE